MEENDNKDQEERNWPEKMYDAAVAKLEEYTKPKPKPKHKTAEESAEYLKKTRGRP